jgi:hypothetical protein
VSVAKRRSATKFLRRPSSEYCQPRKQPNRMSTLLCRQRRHTTSHGPSASKTCTHRSPFLIALTCEPALWVADDAEPHWDDTDASRRVKIADEWAGVVDDRSSTYPASALQVVTMERPLLSTMGKQYQHSRESTQQQGTFQQQY